MRRALIVTCVNVVMLFIASVVYAGGNTTWGVVKSLFRDDPSPVARTVPGSVKILIRFKEAPDPGLVQGLGGKVKRSYHVIPLVAADVPADAVSKLAAHPKVAYVEPDEIVRLEPSDSGDGPPQVLPWGVDRVDAEFVHTVGYKGSGVIVSIIDSGVDLDHPDLEGAVVADTAFVEYTSSGDDDYGHGTHVAGIVAARDNGFGVIGVAPEADLYAVKVINREGWGYLSDVIAGIEWSIDGEADVINMSFGQPGESRALHEVLRKAYEGGIILVAAAGNGGRNIPAAYDEVIAVGGTDWHDRIPPFWSKGPYLELVAPGVGIYSTLPIDLSAGYGYISGTSMSAAHVSGTVALMLSKGIGSEVVRSTLQTTADKLMRNSNAEYPSSWQGYGLVDAEEAVLGSEDGDDLSALPVWP